MFYNVRKKDYLSIKQFLLYLPQVGPQSIKKVSESIRNLFRVRVSWKKQNNFFEDVFCFFSQAWPGKCSRLMHFLGTNTHSKHETLEYYLKYSTVSNILCSHYAWVQHSTFLCILYFTGFMSNGENYSMCFRDQFLIF